MISKEAIEEALVLAQTFQTQNYTLTAMLDTPLASLMMQTIVLTDENGQIDVDGSVQATNSLDKLQGANQHDLVMDEIVSSASKVILDHITYAKETVAPCVGEFISRVRTDMTYRPKAGLNDYEIKVFDLPEPLNCASFVDSLNIFHDVSIASKPLAMILNLPEKTDEELLSLIETGNVEVDDAVKTLIAKEGSGVLRQIYNDVFQAKNQPSDQWNAAGSLFNYLRADKTLVKATLIYILADKLAQAPIEGIELSYEKFKEFIYDLRNSTGAFLREAYRRFHDQCEKDILVRGYPDDKTVLVNGPVYLRVMNDADTTGALLASIKELEDITTLSQFNQAKPKLVALWNKLQENQASAVVKDSFETLKQVLTENMHKMIEECARYKDNPESKSVARKIFKSELDLINVSQVMDLNMLSLRLVCRTLFYETDAERILTSVHENTLKNPSISPREAALIALIELVVDWICSQLEIKYASSVAQENHDFDYWFNR